MLSRRLARNFSQVLQSPELKTPTFDKDVGAIRRSEVTYYRDLPYDIHGAHALPPLPERKVVSSFFESKNMSEQFLMNKFYNLFATFNMSLAAKDYDTLKNVAEERFADKAIAARGKDSSELTWEESSDGACYLFDSLFQQGVYADRSKNDANIHYLMFTGFEGEGIRYYRHKYFEDQQAGYISWMADSESSFNKHKYTKFMAQRDRSMVLRCFGIFQNTGNFFENGAISNKFENEYSGNHIAVFENQLDSPPELSLIDLTHEEWYNHHTINHSGWKIVDIDNFMGGNLFFSEMYDREEFKKTVGKHIE